MAGLCIFAMGYGQNERFKAMFIYNFTNYIEWPGGSGSSFIITVMGESPIIKELEEIAKRKKIGGASIEVKKAGSVMEIGKTHIIFIPSNKKKLLGDVADSFTGKPVLIISDNAQGKFGINLVDNDGKQSFEVSRSQLSEHRLKVDASLFALGNVK